MASDPQTWEELKASLAEWLNRGDLTAKIPEFIALTERKFSRILFVPEREALATITASAETAALPADFWSMRSIYLDAAPRRALIEMPLGDLRDRYAAADTGRAEHYAVQGSTLVLGPIPNEAHSLKITYYQTIPALGEAQATNWLLTAHPDAYIFGSLLMAEAYLVNDERLPVWKLALNEVLDEIQSAATRKQHGGRPLAAASPVRAVRGVRA